MYVCGPREGGINMFSKSTRKWREESKPQVAQERLVFLSGQRNEEKYVTGQKLGHLLGVHVAAGCGIERRRPMQLRSHQQVAKKTG